MNVLIVVRLKGCWGMTNKTKKGLNFLNLSRVHHCVFFEKTEQNLKKIAFYSDYLCYGEAPLSFLFELLQKKGKIKDKDSILTFSDTNEFLKELKKTYRKVIRLNSPKKGLKSIKRTYASKKGDLGKRPDMDKLILRMIH